MTKGDPLVQGGRRKLLRWSNVLLEVGGMPNSPWEPASAAYNKHSKNCWITPSVCWSIVSQMCFFFLPNQTEENPSRVETRSFLMSTRAHGISLGSWQVHSWKYPLIKAITCCPLTPSTYGGTDEQLSPTMASPEGPDLYPSGLPRLPSQKSFLSSYSILWHLCLGLGELCSGCALVTWTSPWAGIMHCSLQHPHAQNSHCIEKGPTNVCEDKRNKQTKIMCLGCICLVLFFSFLPFCFWMEDTA